MISEVMAKLKKTGLSAYALPWFMVLGAKNSGKNTLLAYCGLDFVEEYHFSEDIQFLFSAKAVVIKITAPTTLTPELKEILSFLKKYRPKQPINHLIWVLKLFEDTQLSQIKPLREFLAALIENLACIFPVALFFTHLDSITGFEDFFKNLPNLEQAFGVHPETEILLPSWVLELISEANPISAKLNILNFPSHFSTAYKNLSLFIAALVKITPYQEMPDFGPLFFTSREKFVWGAFHQLLTPKYLHQPPIQTQKALGIKRGKIALGFGLAGIIILSGLFMTRHSALNKIALIQTGLNLGKTVAMSDNPDDFNQLARYLSQNPPLGLKELLEKIFIQKVERKIIPDLINHTADALAHLQDKWALATLEEENSWRGEYVYQLKFYLMACHPAQRYPEFYATESPLINYYLNHSQKNWPERPEITQLSHQQLRNINSLKNSYAGFKTWGEKYPENNFYTEQGFEKLALPEIKRLAATDEMKNKLLDLYKSDYKTAWVNYLQNLTPKPEENYNAKFIQKLLITAHRNMDFEEIDLTDYYKNLSRLSHISSLDTQDTQKLLDSLVKQTNAVILGIADPKARGAIQHVLYLPLKAFYQELLNKNLENTAAQWRSQIILAYNQKIGSKYPFSNSPEEIPPEEFSFFFDEGQGLCRVFISRYLIPYFSQSWLGIKANFSPEFIRAYSQLKYVNNNFNFEIYPEPTVGLREIRFIMGNQNYKYRNDPQEWQVMHWQLNSSESETVLQIITANGSVGSIEATGPWGLIKLLQKAELSRSSNNIFKARWKVRGDNGQVYPVNLLFKNSKENNLLNILLFEKFRLPEVLFVFN